MVKETNLLGMYILDDLKWDTNTTMLVRKANARLQLLRKVASFSSVKSDTMQCVLVAAIIVKAVKWREKKLLLAQFLNKLNQSVTLVMINNYN